MHLIQPTKQKTMNKDTNQNNQNKNLIEQDAPLKNGDHAFVQVGRDGGPVIPHKSDNETGPDRAREAEQQRS